MNYCKKNAVDFICLLRDLYLNHQINLFEIFFRNFWERLRHAHDLDKCIELLPNLDVTKKSAMFEMLQPLHQKILLAKQNKPVEPELKTEIKNDCKKKRRDPEETSLVDQPTAGINLHAFFKLHTHGHIQDKNTFEKKTIPFPFDATRKKR